MSGLTIKDTYRVEELIGSGGMGLVYRARQLSLDRDVAVKTLLARHQFSEDLSKRFFREARLLSQIHHPNIVNILDFGQLESGPLYMVMEFLDGMSVEELTPPKRGVSPRAAAAIMEDTLAGVGAAHRQQMVHRDLKPSNIYLTRVSGGGFMVKILDFGIAKVREEEDRDEKITATGQIMGTPGFISPEQISGQGEADNRSDIYALGAILYSLITGRAPYSGTTAPMILYRQMSEPPEPIDFKALGKPEAAPLGGVILKAMAIDPAERYTNVEEFTRAIRQATGIQAKTVEPEIAAELETLFEKGKARRRRQSSPAGVTSGGDSPTAQGGIDFEGVTVIPTPTGQTPVGRPLLTSSMGGSPTGPLTPPGGTQSSAVLTPPAAGHSRLTVGLVSALVILVFGFMAAQFGLQKGAAKRQDRDSRTRMGGATDQGVTDGEILLGMTGPFSGPSRELGREMRVGLETGFASFNEIGGAHGRKVRLIALDDMMEPANSVANVTRLLDENRVFAIVGSIGTAPNEACLPVLLERKRVLFGPFTGADIFRKDPPDRYVFNYRASYVDESEAIVNYMTTVRNIPAESIAVFAQKDSFGDAGYRTLAKALRKRMVNPDEALRVGYERNSSNVDEAVKEVLARRDKIKGIIMYATYGPAARFVSAARQQGFEPLFASVSFIGSTALAEEFREIGPQSGKGVVVTQVVPHYASSASVVLKYREDLKKYNPSEMPSFASLEGYLVASLLCQGLYRAGEAINSEKLVDALEGLRGFDIGTGETVDFGPADHQASMKVWGSELTETGEFKPIELN